MGNDERETTNSGSVPKGTEDAVAWQPPATLPATLVLPDFYTRTEDARTTLGQETDPSRLGVFLCLLDDRPHLLPTMQALLTHRQRVHGLTGEAPVAGMEWTAWTLVEGQQ